MKNKLLLFSFIVLFGLPAFAHEKGNGGDAVVCRNDKGEILSASLLDYFEKQSETTEELDIALEYQNNNFVYHRFVDDRSIAMNYLESHLFSSFHSSELKAEASHLFDAIDAFNAGKLEHGKVRFVEDLPEIDDSAEVVELPAGCALEQLAVRYDEVEDGRYEYEIKRELWAALPERHRIGLVLHEVVYKFLKATQVITSLNSREARDLHRQLVRKPFFR